MDIRARLHHGPKRKFGNVKYEKMHKILIFKLDGQGRARCEAARRRKFQWKVNVAIPNSSCSNGSWQITPKLYRFLS